MMVDIPEVLRTLPADRPSAAPTLPKGTINASVGVGGINDPDDMKEVKRLLNGISPERGGAFDSLDVKDTSKSGPEFSRLVEAIRIFQKQHLSQFFKADGLVEPKKRTINKLLEEFKKSTPTPPKDKTALTVAPAENLKGFSSEGLKKLGNEWAIDLSVPTCQMVPVNLSRKLLLLGGSSKVRVSTQIDDPDIATISSSDDQSVTITGKPIIDPAKSETDLNIFANGQLSKTVRIIVRRAVTVTVHFHFLGDAAKQKGVFVQGSGAADAILTGMNKVYEPQTNLKFMKGQERTLSRINNREIDFDKTLAVDITNTRAAEAGSQQFRANEFDSSRIDSGSKKAVNVFLVADLTLFDNDGKQAPNLIGSANAIGGRVCWFNATRFTEVGNRFVLISHEVGHSLGLTHIKFLNKALMFPTVQANNVLIPAETLIELPNI